MNEMIHVTRYIIHKTYGQLPFPWALLTRYTPNPGLKILPSPHHPRTLPRLKNPRRPGGMRISNGFEGHGAHSVSPIDSHSHKIEIHDQFIRLSDSSIIW